VTHANPVPGELVGLQWADRIGAAGRSDGGMQLSCSVERSGSTTFSFVTQ
jgi:hypothetical protein